MTKLLRLLCLLPTLAFGQSVPNGGAVANGQVWTVAQWMNAWQSKADTASPIFTGGMTLNGVGVTTNASPAFTGTITLNGVNVPTVASPTLTNPTLINPAVTNIITSPAISLQAPGQSPAQNVPNGSVGLGTIYQLSTRTGGFGQYGNDLVEYNILGATPAGQFDSGMTSWVTHQNLTGGQLFSTWRGANTPGKYFAGDVYTAGAVIGDELNCGNRWADFGLQADVGGTRYVVCEQIVPDVVPSIATAQTVVTITGAASPCVVNWAGNALPANTTVVFNGAGTMPAALTFGTTYYVNTPATNTFQVAASWNGAAITCAAGSSGTINAIPYFAATFGTVYGASVHGARFWTLELNRTDTLMPGGHHIVSNGGSIPATAPQDVINVGGNWINGIDLSAGTFTGPAIKTSNFSQQTFGQAMTVTGNANFYTTQLVGSATTGQSLGLQIAAGTNASDFGLYVTNQAQSVQYLLVRGDGGTQIGTPTGGDPGLGALNVQNAIQQAGTTIAGGATFTIASGCATVSALTGTAVAGSFATTTTGTCAPVLTLPTAAHGWSCNAKDITAAHQVVFTQTATAAASCTVSGATTSGDTIVFDANPY